jgi:hypothetical protein
VLDVHFHIYIAALQIYKHKLIESVNLESYAIWYLDETGRWNICMHYSVFVILIRSIDNIWFEFSFFWVYKRIKNTFTLGLFDEFMNLHWFLLWTNFKCLGGEIFFNSPKPWHPCYPNRMKLFVVTFADAKSLFSEF